MQLRMSRGHGCSEVRKRVRHLRINGSMGGELEPEALRDILNGKAFKELCVPFREALDHLLQTASCPRLKPMPCRMLQLNVPHKSRVNACLGTEVQPDVDQFSCGGDVVAVALVNRGPLDG